MSSHLIDATEMYLRTVYELEEEGIPPIRARLVERLGLSAPAVSETVARLEADGLMHVADDRTLQLSELGRRRAVGVMRKHRLAECLLVDVIGLDWEHVHIEACRWEHVISDAVEQRLTDLLGAPTTDPHGNPIPGLIEAAPAPRAGLLTIAEAAKVGGRAIISRISEKLQGDVAAMRFLSDNRLRPGAIAEFTIERGAVHARVDETAVEVPGDAASHVYVTLAAQRRQPHAGTG